MFHSFVDTFKKASLFSVFFILLLHAGARAQTGAIKGKIVEDIGGNTEPVIGAIVNLEGTQKAAATDIDGLFLLDNIEPGTYSIKVTYIGLSPKVEKNIVVEAGKTTNLNNIRVQEDIKTTDEVVVMGTRQTGSEMSVINEVKKLDVVASAIGSEQIKRTLDRDAADVARRVSGVTVVDNRFVIIRGLNERYNAVMLNGAIAPSFEQDIKSFSLDNLPSQYIDRMVIYKSPSPDLPGDFSGGVVKIYTPGLPAKNFFNVGFSSSIRQGTTFHNFQNQARGKYANLGYDDGTYGLPQDVPPDFLSSNVTRYDNLKIGKLFRNDTWIPDQVKADPDIRFNIQGGYRIKLGGDKLLAFVAGANYSNTYQKIYDARRALFGPGTFFTTNGELVNFYASEMDVQDRNTRVGGIANMILQLNPNNSIEFKNTYTHIGNTQFRNFYFKSSSSPKEFYTRPELVSETNGINLYNTFAGLLSSQLSGKHSVNKTTELNWQTGFARADRDEPDIKSYDYDLNRGVYKWSRYTPTAPTPTQLGRQYFKTIEDIKTVSGDVTKKTIVDLNGQTELSIKGGWYLEERRREFQQRGYGYSPQLGLPDNSGFYNNINVDSIKPIELNNSDSWNNYNGLVIVPTNANGSYNAIAQTNALFLMPKIDWRDKIKLTTGVRLENYSHNISGFKLIKQSWLPSVNASYNVTKKIIIRGSYGKTINRPELREASGIRVFDYYLLRYVNGNPKIKITEVDNFDLKLEYYFSPDEFITFGGFYKHFKNPIERLTLNSQGGQNNADEFMYITYLNAKEAVSRGVEIEARKSLRNILIGSKRDWLKNFTLFCNASIIQSQVKYDRQEVIDSKIAGLEKPQPNEKNEQLDLLVGNGKRSMFGQSPYVLNAGIVFNSDSSKSTINVTYNVVGSRLMLFIPGSGAIYEVPRHVLDLTYIQKVGKYIELKLGIQDLINQKIQFVQDINNDGKVKRITGSGYITDPTNPKSVNGASQTSYSVQDRPAGTSNTAAETSNYNMKDTEFMGFKRGRYYTIGITFKF